MNIVLSCIIGCLAGFCAGKLMKGGGFGLVLNLILGILGGALGGWLFQLLGISWGGIIGQLGTALVGAIIIIVVVNMLKK
ncbi:MAG: GlsB/YeaQ/YmgE family stress response membrane protein [Prevotella sp.]|nr:GlsB/YeaQ/YmgE family stress response membrane protein [Prevotella sp.]MBR4540539.1 GlsB/YeaQ/YmgE family stress response membrane protein [Clostridia bacterium]